MAIREFVCDWDCDKKKTKERKKEDDDEENFYTIVDLSMCMSVDDKNTRSHIFVFVLK